MGTRRSSNRRLRRAEEIEIAARRKRSEQAATYGEPVKPAEVGELPPPLPPHERWAFWADWAKPDYRTARVTAACAWRTTDLGTVRIRDLVHAFIESSDAATELPGMMARLLGRLALARRPDLTDPDNFSEAAERTFGDQREALSITKAREAMEVRHVRPDDADELPSESDLGLEAEIELHHRMIGWTNVEGWPLRRVRQYLRLLRWLEAHTGTRVVGLNLAELRGLCWEVRDCLLSYGP